MLSSTLLPPLNVLLVLLAIVGLIAWLKWRSFIKVHSTAQAALQDTFAKTNGPQPQNVALSLSPLLAEANLEAVAVPADSVVTGKFIHELALRTQTGASIVCIERQNTRMLNPGPDEEILAGDKVLLLGSHEQLTQAKQLLLTLQPKIGQVE
jgi:CPA2 family monovalent cation:H+ antiporter-2